MTMLLSLVFFYIIESLRQHWIATLPDALLTSFAPGFPGSVDGDLHALGIDGDLRGTRADRDRQVEALACNEEEKQDLDVFGLVISSFQQWVCTGFFFDLTHGPDLIHIE